MIINENGYGDKAPEVEEVKESVRAKKLKKQSEEPEVVVVEENAE